MDAQRVRHFALMPMLPFPFVVSPFLLVGAKGTMRRVVGVEVEHAAIARRQDLLDTIPDYNGKQT